jgi:hypothetical protein
MVESCDALQQPDQNVGCQVRAEELSRVNHMQTMLSMRPDVIDV